MPDELQMNGGKPAIPAARLGMRTLAMATHAIARIVGVLALGGPRAVWSQEDPACEVKISVIQSTPKTQVHM